MRSYFWVYKILQYCIFSGFLLKQITHVIQNQNMVSDFWVYFDVKSLSFAKLNTSEISKPLHLRKLVKAEIGKERN